jgi:hypothetical protein
MQITQVDFITSEVEEEDIYKEKEAELEVEDHVGPPLPITEEDHTEQLMDVPTVAKAPSIVSPYPKTTKEL